MTTTRKITDFFEVKVTGVNQAEQSLIESFLFLKNRIGKQEPLAPLKVQKTRKYLRGTGMKSFYLGAFTRQESEFIKSIISQLNHHLRYMTILHRKSKTGLITGSDIHLFSGSSKIGTFRIDINEDSKATHFMTVQDILRLFIKHDIKFDLIIADPPYNARYDRKYGSNAINNITSGQKFLKWLISRSMKVLNPSGLIISKNWRSINPPNSRFVAGMVTHYGGFRRATVIDVFQHDPARLFHFSKKKHLEKWSQCEQGELAAVLGEKGKWTEHEKELVYDRIEDSRKKGIFITDSDQNPLELLDLEVVSPEQFLESSERHDIIIMDECKKIGGAVKLTSRLKEHLRTQLNPSGICVVKTYFNPVLEKVNEKEKEKGIQPLFFLDQFLLYHANHEKIDFLTMYSRSL